MAFQEATKEQAYLKAGFMGFAGSGKTYTAKELAIGLHKYCCDNGIRAKGDPVYFLDTETGSDWVLDDFQEAGIPLLRDKTIAFTALVPAIEQVAEMKGILIIDSITHFWRELTESYATRKKRTKLEFQDWAWLKSQWAKFTTAYINSSAHIILCGRAGFEYDYFENAAGEKELEKTGVKMKAETETGYEPSILVLMTRHQEITKKKGHELVISHSAQVVKDRSTKIDGKVFKDPTFENFLPHVQCLNLGGQHVGVDTTQSSVDIVPADPRDWVKDKADKAVTLDEIQAELLRLHPSSSQAAKTAKADLLEKYFRSRSWKKVGTMNKWALEAGLEALRGHGVGI